MKSCLTKWLRRSRNLKTTLFGAHAFAEVVMAEYERQPAGFALFFHNYSTFLAQAWHVFGRSCLSTQHLRGKGIGKALITFLAKLAVERDCGRLEWSVLDWNQPAIDFYQSLGAVMLHDWRINRVTGDTLANMAAMFPASK
ncbi:MAG: GNAT family N-acetyltransferase [Rheinheimera sp.]|nr:GNAT family N-acetyltransferase [Rheinheimera sp.]